MSLSRRRLLLGLAALPLAACGRATTIREFATSGPTARPGGRGLAQPVQVSYALSRAATVSASLRGPDGREWPLRATTARSPGEEYQLSFDGTVPVGEGSDRQVLADGRYELRLTAVEAGGARDERTATIAIEGSEGQSLDLGGPTLSQALITPDGDGVDDEVRIRLELSRPATVEVAADDDRGNRAAILAPTSRPAGPVELLWDGSEGGRAFGGKRLPDGDYQISVTARDDAGNVRRRGAPLRIANGGVERVEIAEATIAPDRLRLGDRLTVRIRVINSGETTIRTMGPAPSTPYRTSESYSTITAPDGQHYAIVSGAWRVGLGWRDADQELPLRWGLLADAGGQIPPGGSAIVEATVTVDRLPPTVGDRARFWVGAIREGVGMTSGRVGDQVVAILP
jgi:FlgD Ig-like domain